MIKLICMDVDGVLTDGTVNIGDSKEETKSFNVKDGLGIVLAQKSGIRIVFLSGRYSNAVTNRAKELGVEEVYQNAADKVGILKELMTKHGLKKEEVAAIGDDLNDIPILKKVGFPCAVADSAEEVKSLSKHTSSAPGGRGGVREILEMILKAEGLYEKAIKDYLADMEKRR